MEITCKNSRKLELAKRMQRKHVCLIEKIKKDKKIKVLFIVIHKSIWKVDSVFKKMLKDPMFEPEILVCPYTMYGEERMWEEMVTTYEAFNSKGYPVRSSYSTETRCWITLKELQPDIVFFTNPHKLTSKEYYEEAYLNYLSCYVPYFYLVTTHGNDETIYNYDFHNAMWKIFMPHSISMKLSASIAANNGANNVLTGYPACENFLFKKTGVNVWKKNGGKIKVVLAPHHTIEDSELSLSNFLNYSEYFLFLVDSYKENIQWAFKPHPILKSKLYLHPDWGKEKTDRYYEFWDTHENTQLETGEYIDLFLQSDAMIHDCGSFLAEYLFLKKPVMYLENDKTLLCLNKFGKEALSCCTVGNTKTDISAFIGNLLKNNKETGNKENISNFFSNHIDPFHTKKSPSDRIIDHIKKALLE